MSEQAWIIVNGSDYWNNELGWTEYLSSATFFTWEQRNALFPPMGGEWIPILTGCNPEIARLRLIESKAREFVEYYRHRSSQLGNGKAFQVHQALLQLVEGDNG